jgi:hypothetical protein
MTKNRTFSKRLVTCNTIMAWVLMFYSIHEGIGMGIAPLGLSFIAGIGAWYMKVGHDDFKIINTQ